MKKYLALLFSFLLVLLSIPAIAEEGAATDELQIPVYLEEIKAIYDSMEEYPWDFADTPAPDNARFASDNNFPYLGLTLHMPDALLAAIEANEVFLYATELRTGCLDFRYIPEDVRHRTPYIPSSIEERANKDYKDYIRKNGDFLTWFQRDLEPLAQIIIFPDDVLADAEYEYEALTGYPQTEVFAQHGGYSLLYSTVPEENLSEEARAILPALESMKNALVFGDIRPTDDSMLTFMTPPLLVKGDATALATQDLYGNSVTEAVFSEAKLTLLNVWTTWCGPCIAEMPYLNELHNEMAEVQVLGILYDGIDEQSYAPDEEAIATGRAVVEELGLSYRCILPDAALMEGLLSDMQVFPTSYFVDAEGNVVGEPIASTRNKAQWEALINARLAEMGE